MRTILRAPAISFETDRFDVLDLVLAGLLDGCWAERERESAAAVAAEVALEGRGEDLSAESVREAAKAFRYEHNLIAREDLTAWLDARALSVADWRGYLRRRLALEREPAAGPADATPVLRADALCAGTLRRCADRVVAGAAARRALGDRHHADGEGCAERLFEVARATRASGLDTVDDGELRSRAANAAALELAHRRLEAEVATPAAVEHTVAAHVLDWLGFETEELELETVDAAREARLCVLEDGASLGEVAAAVGRPATRRSRLFAEAPPELRTLLVAARPGDVVGPSPTASGFAVSHVLAKTAPSAHDPAMIERARAELLAEAIGRNAAGRVTRHVAL